MGQFDTFVPGVPAMDLVLSPYSPIGMNGEVHSSAQNNPVSQTPIAKTFFGYPFRLWRPRLIYSLFVVNGVTSGFLDIGIYNEDGLRIVSSGSTAQSGGSSTQIITLSPVAQIDPGNYVCGVVFDNITARFMGQSLSVPGRIRGLVNVSNVFPLPATMTLAAPVSTLLPFCGAQMRPQCL